MNILFVTLLCPDATQMDRENPGIVCTAIPLPQLGLINLQVVHRLQITVTIPQHCYGQLH